MPPIKYIDSDNWIHSFSLAFIAFVCSIWNLSHYLSIFFIWFCWTSNYSKNLFQLRIIYDEDGLVFVSGFVDAPWFHCQSDIAHCLISFVWGDGNYAEWTISIWKHAILHNSSSSLSVTSSKQFEIDHQWSTNNPFVSYSIMCMYLKV